MISIICAIAANGAIGCDNRLLYHLRADLRRFKALTAGNTVVMGRRTFESLPGGPLPNRRNIVLTRSVDACRHLKEWGGYPVKPGAELFFAPDLGAALQAATLGRAVPGPQGRSPEQEAGAAGQPTVYIIGGASVYREALPLADRLCLTHIHATPDVADTFFPAVDWAQWRLVCEERHEADEQNAVPFTFADYVRA
ncbi:MAG: dihydrofolate reductase [Alloprevotella sp.]|nr:dihydrofolate reductase [Alloprevotella sp.]